MKRGHVPVRTCRGCGRQGPKKEFVRLVIRQGTLMEDPGYRLSGRGVYCCRNEQCRTGIEKNKKILKTLFGRQD